MDDINSDKLDWVEIQRETFTNWINEELPSTPTHKAVKDIRTDFQTGLRLLALLKVLYTKSTSSTKSHHEQENEFEDSTVQMLVPVHENPTNEFQMRENLEMCLKFMGKMKFSGIYSTGAADIYDGKLNLILGLIYSLIYRYHIQKKVQESPSYISSTSSKSVNVRATTALLSWINWQICEYLPNTKIRNLNVDWTDGIALCALNESIKKGRKVEEGNTPDCAKLFKSNKFKNCEKGLQLGTEFEFPIIISAKHLSSDAVDETSVMIYLCYYLQHCFKKPPQDNYQVPRYIVEFLNDAGLVATPLKKDDFPFKAQEQVPTDATKCIAELQFFKQSTFAVSETIVFTVDCTFAGKGDLVVNTFHNNIENQRIVHKCERSPGIFDCYLKADTVGTHDLIIKWGNSNSTFDHINNSPLTFEICNPEAIVLNHLKNRHNIVIGDKVELQVDISNVGKANILQAKFSDKKRKCNRINSENNVTLTYEAREEYIGSSELTISFNGVSMKTVEIIVASDYCKLNPKIKMQITVFTRYVNYILKESDNEIPDLQWRFQSGVSLAFLLPGFEIGNVNTTPKTRSEMMQNLKECFTYMKSKKLDLAAIGEEDIYYGNIEAILKVLWEIIKFYHICYNNTRSTLEEAMLVWFQTILRNKAFTNFTTDWYDGVLFCHLIEMIEPGLCPEYPFLQSSSAYKNCELAIELAKSHLKLPEIINVDMLYKGNLDEKCMMVYLAFFIQRANELLLTWLKSTIPYRNITNLTTDWCDGINLVALCNVLCPGAVPAWKILDVNNTTNNIALAIKAFEENLDIRCPPTISPQWLNDPQIDELTTSAYLCCFKYAYDRAEASKCIIVFNNQQLINVENPFKFDVEYTGTGTGDVTLYGQDPQSVRIVFKDPMKDEKVYHIESNPTMLIGVYNVVVFWNKILIPGSPFSVCVSNPKLVHFKKLPGEQTTIGKEIVFEIDVKKSGIGLINTTVITLDNAKEEVIFTDKVHELAVIIYTPTITGAIEFVFTFNGVIFKQWKCEVINIPKQEADSSVTALLPANYKSNSIRDTQLKKEHKPCNKCVINGLPLKNGVAMLNKDITFKVTSRGAGIGTPQSIISWPGRKSITLKPKKLKNDVYNFEYKPCEAGRFDIAIFFSGTQLSESPYTCIAIDKNSTGVILLSNLAFPSKDYKFCIQGSYLCNRIIYDPGNNLVPSSEISKEEHFSTVYFTPTSIGSYVVYVEFNGEQIPNSPFIVQCIDPSKCKVLGELPKVLQVDRATDFAVTSEGAGLGTLSLLVNGKEEGKMCTTVVKTQQENSVHTVTLIPRLIGDISIQLLFAGNKIPNSSFKAQICDANQCKVSAEFTKPGNCVVGKTITFTVFSAGAGFGKVVSKVIGPFTKHSAVNIIETDSGTFQCTFTPKEVGEHLIDVMWGIAHVPGSPFNFFVEKASGIKCLAMGSGLNTAIVGKPAKFTIIADSGLLNSGSLCANIKPIQHQVDLQIDDMGTGQYDATYVAPEVGEYTTEIKYYGRDIIFSPFKIDVVDPSKCQLRKIKCEDYTNTPQKLLVDTSEGGNGMLTATVLDPHGQYLDVIIEEANKTRFVVIFVAQNEGLHTVSILWSDTHIPGSPFELNVKQHVATNAAMVKAFGNGLQNGKLQEWAEFTVETKQAGQGVLAIIAHTNGAHGALEVRTEPKGDGMCIARYLPTTVGNVSLIVKWSGNHIPGSPFIVQIADVKKYLLQQPAILEKVVDCQSLGASAEHVDCKIQHLTDNPIIDEPVEFSVDVTDAGEGSLRAKVTGPKNAPVQVHSDVDKSEGVIYNIKFIPTIVGKYTINVSWNDKGISTSPFDVNVVDPSKCVISKDLPLRDGVALLNKDISFKVITRGAGSGTVQSIISQPGKKRITLKSIDDKNGAYAFKYKPSEVGKFEIIILYSNIELTGSPYTCITIDVDSTGVIFPDLAFPYEPYRFYLQGNRSYNTVVYDPQNNHVDTKLAKANRCSVATFTPVSIGSYVVFVDYKGENIPNSPFFLRCIDPTKCEIIGNLPDTLQIGKKTEFTVTSTNAGLGTLSLLINDEEEGNRLCTMAVKTQQEYSVHKVTLTPRLVGDISVKILFSGYAIPKSPIKAKILDANQCKIIGDLTNTGQVFPIEKAVSFRLITAGAGFGKPIFKVYGPTTRHYTVHFSKNTKNTYFCSFTPAEGGEYAIYVTWGIAYVPGSPYNITVDKPSDVVCTAAGSGLYQATIGKPACFTITANESGLLESQVIDVNIVAICHKAEVQIEDKGNGVYSVTYTAEELGSYVAKVKHYGQRIVGSPFKIDVVQEVDVSKCKVSGIKMEGASYYTDSPHELYIDTSEGGSGVLNVTVLDPTNQPLYVNIKKVNEGKYTITFIAEREGVHTVNVLWSEMHVPGSPFKIHVKRLVPVNAQMVKAYGPGLRNGNLQEWAEFTVETNQAGDGILSVTALSSKRSFAVTKEPKGSDAYMVRYNPTIAGVVYIIIKWSGVNIPGSPFKVDITDYSPLPPETTLIVTNPMFPNFEYGVDDEEHIPGVASPTTEAQNVPKPLPSKSFQEAEQYDGMGDIPTGFTTNVQKTNELLESADTDLAHYQHNKGSENGKEGTNPEAIKIKLDKAQDLISQFQEFEDPQLYATWEKLKIELQRLLAIYNRILISLESAAVPHGGNQQGYTSRQQYPPPVQTAPYYPPAPYYPQRPMQQTSNTTVVVVGGGGPAVQQTTIIQRPRKKVNHVLHFLITFFLFPPWIIVWIILCCIYGC